jgi:hypothetical protein
VFCLWIFSFLTIICWRVFLSVIYIYNLALLSELEACSCICSFLSYLSYSFGLCVCFCVMLFLLLQFRSIIQTPGLGYHQLCSFYSVLLWVITLWGFVCFHMNFRIDFSVYMKNDIGILMEIAFNLRLLLPVHSFSQY